MAPPWVVGRLSESWRSTVSRAQNPASTVGVRVMIASLIAVAAVIVASWVPEVSPEEAAVTVAAVALRALKYTVTVEVPLAIVAVSPGKAAVQPGSVKK